MPEKEEKQTEAKTGEEELFEFLHIEDDIRESKIEVTKFIIEEIQSGNADISYEEFIKIQKEKYDKIAAKLTDYDKARLKLRLKHIPKRNIWLEFRCIDCEKIKFIFMYPIDKRSRARKSKKCRQCYGKYVNKLHKERGERMTEEEIQEIIKKDYKCGDCDKVLPGTEYFFIRSLGRLDTSKCKACKREYYLNREFSKREIERRRVERNKKARIRRRRQKLQRVRKEVKENLIRSGIKFTQEQLDMAVEEEMKNTSRLSRKPKKTVNKKQKFNSLLGQLRGEPEPEPEPEEEIEDEDSITEELLEEEEGE